MFLVSIFSGNSDDLIVCNKIGVQIMLILWNQSKYILIYSKDSVRCIFHFSGRQTIRKLLKTRPHSKILKIKCTSVKWFASHAVAVTGFLKIVRINNTIWSCNFYPAIGQALINWQFLLIYQLKNSIVILCFCARLRSVSSFVFSDRTQDKTCIPFQEIYHSQTVFFSQ